MIYWRSDLYGYNGDISTISLDSAELLDSNRPFTIQTSYEDTEYNRRCTVQEQYDMLYSKFGENMSSIYCVPDCNYNNPDINSLIQFWFPSVFLGYPNSFSNFETRDYYILHLKSLDRAIILDAGSDFYVASVSGKSLSILAQIKNSDHTLCENQLCYYNNNSLSIYITIPTIYNYSEDIDIGDYLNWRFCRAFFSLETGQDGIGNQYYQKPYTSTDLQDFIRAIFPTGKEQPDGSIGGDPFEPGGESGTGGGGGSFDNTTTPIEIPNLPSISAASTGFISLFNPSLSQLNDLASYLWSDLFEIDGWKKLFADPMDAILGLSILPVAVPPGGTREVKVGNIGTGISLTVAGSQFVEVDCGSIDVNEYWGAYLDYEPYTQAQIFLPYIGTRPISVDDIMGKTVRVVYHVDILTGACCCFVKCGESVLYTYNGQCSIPIPITGANYTSVVNGVISIAASVGSLVATGGASAPIALPSIASSAVNQMKPQVEKSGSISGSAGVLNMQIPYLILIRPRQALPSKQNEFIGYPSLITVQLTELSGYTEVQSIHLENIPATQEELAEIQSLLEGGVIF